MRRSTPIVAVLLVQVLYAGAKMYQTGKLNDVVIKDMTTTISLPVGPDSLPFPLHIGINYEFQISTDDNIVYFGSCWSKGKRNYGSDWVVKDPIEFRVEKDRLFLKRPSKGELRLALMGRFRTVATKDEAGADHQSLQPLAPYAARQIEPECH
jgi:hypothetical protein